MNARLTIDERAELERLRRLTQEQAEELSLWREAKREGLEQECDYFRFRFGLAPSMGFILAELADCAPAAVSKERLLEATQPSWRDRNQEPEIKIVDVHVCRLRKRLEVMGFSGAIQTHWGFGFSMSADVAAALRPQETEKAA